MSITEAAGVESGGGGESAPFDEDRFETELEAAISACTHLSADQARHFVEHGYVVVPEAFDRDLAAAIREAGWTELIENKGIDRDDPASWDRPFDGGGHGYVRAFGGGRRIVLADEAPGALAAQADAVGGIDRLRAGGDLAWYGGVIANLGVENDLAWEEPHPRQPGWHKDGWHFRHFLSSPEQALLIVPLYSDILPRSGGTSIATDSIGPVARLLAAHPQGVHADGTQAGYLIPGLIEQCRSFTELIGNAGDMVILHPYVLHRVAPNPSDRPRFISNQAPQLGEPMRFDREPGDPHSLVELTVLRALDTNRLAYRETAPREAVVPPPSRTDEQRAAIREVVAEEMRAMAAAGVLTPAWATEVGYPSNRET